MRAKKKAPAKKKAGKEEEEDLSVDQFWKTYKTKKRENRPDLHKVLLWIHPTRVGKGDVERTITRVRR